MSSYLDNGFSGNIDTLVLKVSSGKLSDTLGKLNNGFSSSVNIIIDGDYHDLTWINDNGEEENFKSYSDFTKKLLEQFDGCNSTFKIIPKIDWNNILLNPTDNNILIIDSDCGYTAKNIKYSYNNGNYDAFKGTGKNGYFKITLGEGDRVSLKQVDASGNDVENNVKEYVLNDKAITEKDALSSCVLDTTSSKEIRNIITFEKEG